MARTACLGISSGVNLRHAGCSTIAARGGKPEVADAIWTEGEVCSRLCPELSVWLSSWVLQDLSEAHPAVTCSAHHTQSMSRERLLTL